MEKLQKFGIPKEKIFENARIDDDLDLNGIRLAAFFRICEEKYKVKLPETIGFEAFEMGTTLITVGDLVTIIYDKVHK